MLPCALPKPFSFLFFSPLASYQNVGAAAIFVPMSGAARECRSCKEGASRQRRCALLIIQISGGRVMQLCNMAGDLLSHHGEG